MIDLSIIVTIYNGEKSLEKCLHSILSQKAERMEVICVNDGSTDASAQLLARIAGSDDRIRLIEQENRGVWYARENGWKSAAGKWITFVDCDDTVKDGMYSAMLEIGESNAEIDFVVCGFNRVNADTEQIYATQMTCWGKRIMDCRDDDTFLLAVNPSMCNKLFRRELFEKAVVLQTAPRIMEDLIFSASVYPICRKVAFTDAAFYQYYDQQNSVTKSIGRRDIETAKTALLVLKEFFDMTWPERKDLLANLIFLHLGVGMLVNYNETARSAALFQAHRNVRRYLNHYFPEWKTHTRFRLRNVRRVPQIFKFYLVFWIYRTPLFVAAVQAYHLLCRLFHIEAKW